MKFRQGELEVANRNFVWLLEVFASYLFGTIYNCIELADFVGETYLGEQILDLIEGSQFSKVFFTDSEL